MQHRPSPSCEALHADHQAGNVEARLIRPARVRLHRVVVTLWSTAAILLMALTPPACSETIEMQPSIQEVRAKHVERLMSTPGVVSVGIGRDEEGAAVIVVGLDKERAGVLESLPVSLEGYEVRTEVVGKITPE